MSTFLCTGNVREQQGSLQPDPEIVNQLVGMGFSENGSKRAAVATQVSNMGVAELGCHASWALGAMIRHHMWVCTHTHMSQY